MPADNRFDNNYVAAFSRFELLYRLFLIPLGILALIALSMAYHRITTRSDRSYVFHETGGAIEVYIPSYPVKLPVPNSKKGHKPN